MPLEAMKRIDVNSTAKTEPVKQVASRHWVQGAKKPANPTERLLIKTKD